eukprot:gene1642-4776_t
MANRIDCAQNYTSQPNVYSSNNKAGSRFVLEIETTSGDSTIDAGFQGSQSKKKKFLPIRYMIMLALAVAVVLAVAIGLGVGLSSKAGVASTSTTAKLSSCNVTEYELFPPTTTSDRHCAAITNCILTEYEEFSPTTTTDRKCTKAELLSIITLRLNYWTATIMEHVFVAAVQLP